MELPLNLAAVSREIDLMVWWKSYEAELPDWARVLSTYNYCNCCVAIINLFGSIFFISLGT